MSNRDLTFGNSDVLKEEEDGCYRELRAQGFDQESPAREFGNLSLRDHAAHVRLR